MERIWLKVDWVRHRLRHIDRFNGRALLIVTVLMASTAATAFWAVGSERCVTLTVHADKMVYASGESVQIYTHLANYGLRTVELTYPTGGVISIHIYDWTGRCVFFAPEYVTMAMTDITLKLGEVFRSNFEWNQEDRADEQVRLPGSFLVVATSCSHEANYCAHSTIFYLGR